jgi:hypothetical protein
MTFQHLEPSRPGTAGSAPMTTVYVDTRALFVGGAAGSDAARLAPDADSALDHLREAGIEVVLLGGADAGREEAVHGRVRLADLPEDPRGWMVVGDAAACARGRPCRHLRTILVGPAAPARGLASRACDVEARDLTDAALTIIAAEAMEPARDMPTPDAATAATMPHGTATPAPAP